MKSLAKQETARFEPSVGRYVVPATGLRDFIMEAAKIKVEHGRWRCVGELLDGDSCHIPAVEENALFCVVHLGEEGALGPH